MEYSVSLRYMACYFDTLECDSWYNDIYHIKYFWYNIIVHIQYAVHSISVAYLPFIIHLYIESPSLLSPTPFW